MKTVYFFLVWIFGISAFSAIISGVVSPMNAERITEDEAAFRFFFIVLPLIGIAVFCYGKSEKYKWEDDLVYLVLMFFRKRIVSIYGFLSKKSNETKEKIKKDLES